MDLTVEKLLLTVERLLLLLLFSIYTLFEYVILLVEK